MHLYTVTDVNHSRRLVAFRDQLGRYHAAHCTSLLPEVGEELRGSSPNRGFTLLIGSDGSVCRMTFSQVNCGQTRVFGVLHTFPEQRAQVAFGLRPAAFGHP